MRPAFREVIDSEFPDQLGFLAKFNWQDTDLLQHEFKELCITLIKNKECYAQNKYDIGNPDLEYHITLKKDAKLDKQRMSRVPVQLEDKLDKLLRNMQLAGIIREVGTQDLNSKMARPFFNPFILNHKGPTLKLMIDARALNSTQ